MSSFRKTHAQFSLGSIPSVLGLWTELASYWLPLAPSSAPPVFALGTACQVPAFSAGLDRNFCPLRPVFLPLHYTAGRVFWRLFPSWWTFLLLLRRRKRGRFQDNLTKTWSTSPRLPCSFTYHMRIFPSCLVSRVLFADRSWSCCPCWALFGLGSSPGRLALKCPEIIWGKSRPVGKITWWTWGLWSLLTSVLGWTLWAWNVHSFDVTSSTACYFSTFQVASFSGTRRRRWRRLHVLARRHFARINFANGFGRFVLFACLLLLLARILLGLPALLLPTDGVKRVDFLPFPEHLVGLFASVSFVFSILCSDFHLMMWVFDGFLPLWGWRFHRYSCKRVSMVRAFAFWVFLGGMMGFFGYFRRTNLTPWVLELELGRGRNQFRRSRWF